MPKRSWCRVLGLSVVLVLLVTAACEAGSRGAIADRSFLPRWWERPAIAKQLDLSEEQLATIREIAGAGATKIRLLRESYLDEQKALKKLLIREILDDQEIEHRLDALGAALLALSRAEVDMNVAMSCELTADQRARLLPLIESLREQGVCPDKKPRKRLERRYNRF